MDRVERFTQAYSKTPWRAQIQLLGLFSLLLVVGALVAGIYLSVSAQTASIGRDIQEMQVEIEEIERVNANTQAKIAKITASAEMESRARAMGFRPIEAEETRFLKVPGYPGRQPVILAPSNAPTVVGASQLPHVYTESLFTWLQRQMGGSSFPLFKVRP